MCEIASVASCSRNSGNQGVATAAASASARTSVGEAHLARPPRWTDGTRTDEGKDGGGSRKERIERGRAEEGSAAACSLVGHVFSLSRSGHTPPASSPTMGQELRESGVARATSGRDVKGDMCTCESRRHRRGRRRHQLWWMSTICPPPLLLPLGLTPP